MTPATAAYHALDSAHAALAPARMWAGLANAAAPGFRSMLRMLPLGGEAIAAADMLERMTRRYPKQDFAVERAGAAGREVEVRQETVASLPFCDLVRFAKVGREGHEGRRLLLVAPMSGHHATLLRETVRRLAGTFDLHLTDWKDASEVALAEGGFSLGDYADYIASMLRLLGPGTALMAVCQPSVPALAAAAFMAEDGDPCRPSSLVLLGGPVDTRLSPTGVNRFATSRDLSWFERNLIARVPFPRRGAGRRVYPGFLQLSGFMSMNAERHAESHREMMRAVASGNEAAAGRLIEFYDEYMAVMDLPAEFYLETVRDVFIEHRMPLGTMECNGRRVDLAALSGTPLMTVEGGRDDITGAGQTHAAHVLCGPSSAAPRIRHTEPEAGHYGIFSGSRFRDSVAPAIERFAGALPG